MCSDSANFTIVKKNVHLCQLPRDDRVEWDGRNDLYGVIFNSKSIVNGENVMNDLSVHLASHQTYHPLTIKLSPLVITIKAHRVIITGVRT